MIWNYMIASAVTFAGAWFIRSASRSSRRSRLACALIAVGASLCGGVLLALLARQTYADIGIELGVPIHTDVGRLFMQFFAFSVVAVYLALRSPVAAGSRPRPAIGDMSCSAASPGSATNQRTVPAAASSLQPPIESTASGSGNIQPASPSDGLTGERDAWAYSVVADELDTGKQEAGLWLRTFVDADGDATKQKVAYVKARVAVLVAAHLTRLEQLATQKLMADEAARKVADKESARQQFSQLFTEQAFRGRLAIFEVERLIELACSGDVPIETADQTGTTLLMIAAACGAEGAVKKLLDLGADPNALDGAGLGPLYYAESAREHHIKRILLDRGAKRRPRAGVPTTSASPTTN